jgi:hypothetical protein
MSDPSTAAVDRLDELHRTHSLPVTCTACHSHGTTSADGICGACRYDRRHLRDWSST